ncbi:hypothetical protein FO519_000599 [Halicephalobus sp. NKZ332]|nr:hypothetical protein FO519_000599 [Halicephalobus sp. NKZ332]
MAGSSACEQDGNFAIDRCSRVFRVCKNGVQSFSECPDGFFFNVNLGACADHCEVIISPSPARDQVVSQNTVYQETIPQNPVIKQKIVVPQGNKISYVTALPQFAEPEPVRQSEDLEVDKFMAGSSACEQDGNFAMDKCSRIFRVCRNGVQSFFECPDGYFFNPTFDACADNCDTIIPQAPATNQKDIPQNPVANQQTASQNKAYVTALPQLAEPQPSKETIRNQPETSSEVDAFMVGNSACEQDGNLAMDKCSRVFRVCKNGVQSFFECPDGYFFNPSFDACADNCDAIIPQASATNQKDISQNPARDQQAISQNLGYEKIPEAPVYQDVTQAPVYEKVPEIPVYQETTQAPVYEKIPQNKVSYEPQAQEYENSLEVDAYSAADSACTHDGSFAVAECSRVFRVCKNGVQSLSECPDRYFFNTNLGACADHCGSTLFNPVDTYRAVVPEKINEDVPVDHEYGSHGSESGYKASTVPPAVYVTETAPYQRDPTTSAPSKYFKSRPGLKVPVTPFKYASPAQDSVTAPHNYHETIQDSFHQASEVQESPVEQASEVQHAAYKVDDEFSKDAHREPVLIYVNNRLRDGFDGRPIDLPIKNPFDVPRKTSSLRSDGFDRGNTPERPVVSPFGNIRSQRQRLRDGFDGEPLDVPLVNPFAHFEKRRDHDSHTKVGYAVAGSQTDDVSILKQSEDENEYPVEGSTTSATSNKDENKSEEVSWRKRRSADSICHVKKFAYRPESLFSNENSRTRSIDNSQTAASSKPSLVNPECSGRNRSHKFASGFCRRSFFECIQNAVVLQSCVRPGEVFSTTTNECVPIVELSECQPAQPSLDVPTEDSEFFCQSRRDGFYQHPVECSRILQCFGGELFEHSSCEHNLGFDERRGACDYRQNIPGCGGSGAITMNDSSSGCNGHEHGAHIANDGDCGSFYRCVWDRLELMTCPQGTVFNPALSVCDYPDSVPNCSSM